MSVDSAVKDLLSRLEKVTARLESVEKDLASGARGGGGGGAASAAASSGPAAAFVDAYQGLIDEYIKPYVVASKKISEDVGAQAELVLSAVNAQKVFLEAASQSKKPDAAGLQKLIAATSKAMGEVSEFREANRKSKHFNNLSGISEGIGALGWVVVEKTPGPFVNEGRASSEFYTNKLLTAHKNSDKEEDKLQVDWVKHWNGFLKELFTYIKANHTTGVTWNPNGGDAASFSGSAAPVAVSAPVKKEAAPPAAAAKKAGLGNLFGEINAVGAGAKPTLNKVTKDMKSSAQKDKSSVVKAKAGGPQAVVQGKLNLNGNKWEVEDWKGGDALVIDQTEPKHVLYIYNCERKTIQVKGKINNITLDKCKRVSLVFETAIAAVECVNCTSLEIQCVNSCPTYTVDATSGFLLYVGNEGKKFELTQSKSAEINIMIPGASEDVDQVELNVPDQFVTSIGDDGKLVTRPMVHTG